MWGEFNSARLIFVLFPFFCWASLYFIESCWAKRRTIETYPQYSASLPIISFSHPHLPSSTTPRHAQKAHMPTHMYTPTPQLQWLPVSTPASVVYMALPIEQMLWNLRCKTTPPSPPMQLTHACIYTHTQPSLSLPPAGPAMNMPCGAPFPLALWLWLCQLCRVWPPPTGKTKKTADSKCTLSLCAVWESVCVCAFVSTCRKLKLSVFWSNNFCKTEELIFTFKRRNNSSDVLYSLMGDGTVRVCDHLWVCVPFASFSVHRCTAYAVCTACHAVSPYVLIVNPLGNGGGIPVTMEMSKLAYNKISTWERLI